LNSLNIYFYKLTIKIYPKKFFFEKKFLKNWPKNFQNFIFSDPPKKSSSSLKNYQKNIFFQLFLNINLGEPKKKGGFFFRPLAIMVVFKNNVL
jgi:hypothetical protein